MTDNPFALAERAAESIHARFPGVRPKVAVVLGSGWGPAADLLGDTVAECSFADLPGFPASTVPGHGGALRHARAGAVDVLVFRGRVHLYEGHGPATVVHGVRSAVAAGAGIVILTNACGSINPAFPAGTPVLLRDHVNLTGQSPMAGPPPPEPYAIRFVDMTEAYSPRLRALARGFDPSLDEGVYAQFLGPQYETPAEIHMARTIGADLVGMSTAIETIAARHVGAEVLAVSLVTNLAAGLQGKPLDHAEVVAEGQAAGERVGRLLRKVIEAA
jgi:purine-nucleoside phosphorylase